MYLIAFNTHHLLQGGFYDRCYIAVTTLGEGSPISMHAYHLIDMIISRFPLVVDINY